MNEISRNSRDNASGGNNKDRNSDRRIKNNLIKKRLKFASEKKRTSSSKFKPKRLRKPLYDASKEEEIKPFEALSDPLEPKEISFEEKDDKEEDEEEVKMEIEPEERFEKILRKPSKKASISSGTNTTLAATGHLQKSFSASLDFSSKGRKKKRDVPAPLAKDLKDKISKKASIKKSLKTYSDLVKVLSNHIKYEWFESGPFQNKLIPSKRHLI